MKATIERFLKMDNKAMVQRAKELREVVNLEEEEYSIEYLELALISMVYGNSNKTKRIDRIRILLQMDLDQLTERFCNLMMKRNSRYTYFDDLEMTVMSKLRKEISA